MKNEVEPFDSLEFRQSMDSAVDNMDSITDVLSGFGSPLSKPTPPEVDGSNPDLADGSHPAVYHLHGKTGEPDSQT